MDFMQIDNLAKQAVFGENKQKNIAYLKLWQIGQENGIKPASINDFYMARGRGELPLDFTVPAINIRGMAYDMARVVFKVAVQKQVGALIFEIARSEITYTDQTPQEFVAVMIAAALREGFVGPLFIQGDHFQVKVSDKAGIPKTGEVDNIKNLIKESIEAGFYNIDLDISTLVDYGPKDLLEQQKNNYELAAKLTEYVREIEPDGVTVSLGGEIGHIGGKNSNEEELHAYMGGYKHSLKLGLTGLSKISIQTGTHHGGVPLADGSLAKIDVDFAILKKLAQVSRKYGMGGTVQHGASTLPDEFFAQFPKSEAIEVHLATGFQNIMMDHPSFPSDLLNKIYRWMDKDLSSERKKDMSDKQFYYKLRKKAWGQFKHECWNINEDLKADIRTALAKRFVFMFRELNVENTKTMINKYTKTPAIKKTKVYSAKTGLKDSRGLAD